MNWTYLMRFWKYTVWGIAPAALIFAIVLQFIFLSAPGNDTKQEQFIVGQNMDTKEAIEQLKEAGFIKSAWGFRIALGLTEEGSIAPGGYKISKGMNAWELARIFEQEPYMKWVTILPGMRKEEIAEILMREFGWNEDVAEKWMSEDTAPDFEHSEGVYFPDTYLIPSDESPENIAKRLRAKFDEKFAPFLPEAYKQNIRWPTLVRVASLIQREAAGEHDMKLISGIIWNRLLSGMKLDIDATLQYAKGKANGVWWGPVKPEDKEIDSPYNTYKRKGLPPLPISNPGISAIEAALYPEKTKCLYYLHDAKKQIHCAETYKEHQANIELFLR